MRITAISFQSSDFTVSRFLDLPLCGQHTVQERVPPLTLVDQPQTSPGKVGGATNYYRLPDQQQSDLITPIPNLHIFITSHLRIAWYQSHVLFPMDLCLLLLNVPLFQSVRRPIVLSYCTTSQNGERGYERTPLSCQCWMKPSSFLRLYYLF